MSPHINHIIYPFFFTVGDFTGVITLSPIILFFYSFSPFSILRFISVPLPLFLPTLYTHHLPILTALPAFLSLLSNAPFYLHRFLLSNRYLSCMLIVQPALNYTLLEIALLILFGYDASPLCPDPPELVSTSWGSIVSSSKFGMNCSSYMHIMTTWLKQCYWLSPCTPRISS